MNENEHFSVVQRTFLGLYLIALIAATDDALCCQFVPYVLTSTNKI